MPSLAGGGIAAGVAPQAPLGFFVPTIERALVYHA